MPNPVDFLRSLGRKVEDSDQMDQFRRIMLELPSPRNVDIEFSDLFLTTTSGFRTKKKKVILNGLSGKFRSGELTAIMGPSGAGKSTLLNALTGYTEGDLTGRIQVGDRNCVLGDKNRNSLKVMRKQWCYILQDDRLNPLFTVLEIMTIAADLKLGSCLTEKIKQTVVRDVLETLGLSGTENTRCINLSGGQRKRLSIALELIDNPPVIFLDEPTTGLDSVSSQQCIELLKSLARAGRTIVCTVHQPTASLYELFDQVYILADGLCIYHGDSANTVPYLASVGLQCPMYHNPADYILEVANGEYGKFTEQLSIENRKKDWTKKGSLSIRLPEKSGVFSCEKTSMLVTPPSEMYKFLVLLNRSIMHMSRDYTVCHLKVILHILIGIMLGIIFQGAGGDGSRSINNAGFILVSIVYLSYTSTMPGVFRYPVEMLVIKKEHFNNWYKLSTYYIASVITGMPMQIFFSIMYSIASYFLTGQPIELYRFSMFVVILSLVSLIADAVGNIIGTIVNPINGTFWGAVVTCIMCLFAGFLVMFNHMPEALTYVAYISYMKYAMEGLVVSVYAYDRPTLDCPDDILYCHYRLPSKILDELAMNKENYKLDAFIMLAMLFAYRVIAYYTLKRNIKLSI